MTRSRLATELVAVTLLVVAAVCAARAFGEALGPVWGWAVAAVLTAALGLALAVQPRPPSAGPPDDGTLPPDELRR